MPIIPLVPYKWIVNIYILLLDQPERFRSGIKTSILDPTGFQKEFKTVRVANRKSASR